MGVKATGEATVIDGVSNGAAPLIELDRPVVVEAHIIGRAPLLMHAWNVEAIEEKANAAKGSVAKKTDDIESYIYRDPDTNLIGIPGVCIAAAMREAARSIQDPRSPRKSGMDLVKGGVIPLDAYATLFRTDDATGKEIPYEAHDFLHQCRVVVQRSGVTRTRPGFNAGWQCRFRLMIATPNYLPLQTISYLLTEAGRLNGLCDFRPSYGRFSLLRLKVEVDTPDEAEPIIELV
jgi:hypothetical protein